MIKLILKEHNEDRVIYHYYFNGDENDHGIIEYDFKSKTYKSLKELKGYGGMLPYKAEKCLKEAVENNDFRNELMLAWY